MCFQDHCVPKVVVNMNVKQFVKVCDSCLILYPPEDTLCRNRHHGKLSVKDVDLFPNLGFCMCGLMIAAHHSQLTCCTCCKKVRKEKSDIPSSMFLTKYEKEEEDEKGGKDGKKKDLSFQEIIASCFKENEKALKELTALFGEDPIDNAVESFSRLEKQVEHLSAIVPETCSDLVEMKDLLEKMQPLIKKARIHKKILALVGKEEEVISKLSTYLESCDIIESWEVPEPVDDMKMLENMLEKEM
jgi:hypothetical protein